MKTNEIKVIIEDMEMSLEELIFERLGMTYQDLLYDLHYRILECNDKFEDLERHEDIRSDI